MDDIPKRRLILIAKIFFVAASLTLLLAFLLPAMLSRAYVSRVILDDTQADFEQGAELDLTVAVSRPVNVQGLELQPLAAWDAWLTDTITSTNNMQPFPYSAAGGAVDLMAEAHEGKIYVVGGYGVNGTSNESDKTYTATIIASPGWASDAVSAWVTQTAATGLPARSAGALVISPTSVATYSYLYVIGGYDSNLGAGESLSTVYSATVNNFTGEVSTWTKVLTLTDPNDAQIIALHYHSAVLHKGVIYVIGGYCRGETVSGLNSCDAGLPFGSTSGHKYSRRVYTATIQADGSLSSPNATLGYWGVITEALPQVRAQGAAIVYEGPTSTTIYYMGGRDGTRTEVNTIYYSDILADGGLTPWQTSTATLSQTLSTFGLVLARGEVIQVGGYNGTAQVADVTGAVPSNDTTSRLHGFGATADTLPFWFLGPPLPAKRAVHATVAYDDRIFAIGGYNGISQVRTVYHTRLSTTCSGTCTYPPQGIYVSRVFSTSDYVSGTIGRLSWDASIPISTGLAMYYHAATTPSALESTDWITMGFSLLTGTYSYNFSPPISQPVYFQYRAVLTSAWPNRDTPLLDSVSFLQETVNPDLAITKTTAVTQVIPGQVFTYAISLVYTNTWTGPYTATVTETIPLSTTYVGSGWTADGTAADGRSMYVRQVYLPTSTTGVLLPLSITVQAAPSLPGGVTSLPLTNTVEAGYVLTDALNPVITDPTPANNIYTHTIYLLSLGFEITKTSAPPGILRPLDVLTYTITLTKTGLADASNVVVTDVVDSRLDIVNPGSGTPGAGNAIVWNLGTVAGSSPIVLTFTARITRPFSGGPVITNTVTVDSDQTEPASALETRIVTAAPVLGISKNAVPAPGSTVYNGESIRYILTFSNTGDMDASGVRITDVVNTGVFSSVVPGSGGSYTPPNVTWNIGYLGVLSGPQSVSFTATVGAYTITGTVYNSATIGSPLTGTASSNVVTHTIATTTVLPVLGITKGAIPPPGSTVLRGGQILYILTYTVGNTDATGVRITDVVNTSVFSSVTPGPGGVYASGVLTFSLPTVAVGTHTASFTATVGAYAITGTVYNSATIGCSLTGTASSNVVTHTIAATAPTTGGPVLSIVKNAIPPHGSTVPRGGQILYILTYTVGNTDATGVRITDVVDTSPSGGILDVVADKGGTYSPPNVIWDIGYVGVLSGPQSVRLTATIRPMVVSGTQAIDSATIGSPLTGTASSNVVTHTIIYSGGLTTLEIAKTVDLAFVDQYIQRATYRIYITNTGSAAAQNLVVTDTLPQGIGDIWIGPYAPVYPAGPQWLGGAAGNVVNFFTDWGPLTPANNFLNPGAASVLRFEISTTLPITDRWELINSNYRVTADNVTGVVTGTPVSFRVNAPEWGITKMGPPDADAGGPISYTVRITNTGHLTVFYSYILTDLLPGFTNFDACNPGCASGAGAITWTFGPPLYIGDSLTATLYLTVSTPLTNGLVITNNCAVTGTDVIPMGVCQPVTTTIHSSPILTITKRGLPEPVDAGGVLTYTITVENEAAANGIALHPVVTDTVPGNAIFFTATGGLTVTAPPVGGTGLVTWELPSLWPGQSATVTMAVTITSPLRNGTIITNYAAVTDTDALTGAVTVTTNTVRSSPDITMTKTVTPDLVLPGETVTYTIVLTNRGNASAEDALVTDTLPFTFGTMIAGPVPTYVPPNVVWTATITGRPLDAPSGPPLTLAFTATASLIPGVYSNTVTVTTGISMVVIGPTAPVTVALPELLITKVAPITIPAGSLLTYTISYTNVGPVPAYGSIITDRTPPYTVFFTATGGSGVTGPPLGGTGVVTWSIGTVWPNTGGVVTMVVTVTSPLTGGTVITNFVWMTSTHGVSATATATTTVVAEPLLVTFKGATPPNGSYVQPGSTITYTVTVTNLGSGNALDLLVTDPVPTYTNYVNGTASGTPGGSWSNADPLTYTIASLPGGGGVVTFTFAVTVQTPLTNGTRITNVAYVSATNTPAITYSNPVTHIVVSTPTLVASKAAAPPHGSTVRPGDTITYTITVTNVGDAAAVGVVITDPLPLYTNYVAGSASGTPGGSPGSGDPLTYTIASLPGGGGVLTFTFRVTVTTPLTNGTIISDRASVYGEQSSGAWTGITSTNAVTHLVESSPAFSVSKTAAPPHGSDVAPGATIAYTVILTNNGDGYAIETAITDTLPTYTNYVLGSLAGTSGYYWTTSPDPLAIRWYSLAGNGGVLTFTFNVTVTTPLTNGTIISDFARAGAAGVPISYTNEVTHRVVSTPSLQILKVAEPPHGSDIAPGSAITYTIVVTNVGDGNALSLLITDPLPAHANYNSGTASGTPGGSWNDASPLTYTIASLAGNGGVVTFTFQVTVDIPLTNGTIITDIAQVVGDMLPLTPTNEVTHRVVSVSAIEVAKAAVPPHGASVSPGDTITYTVTITNVGTTPLDNLLVTDTVPNNTQYVAGSLSGSGTTGDGGPLTMTISSLAPFAPPVTFTFRVTVNLLTPNGTIIANTAWITASQTGITRTNNVTHVVVSTATLQLSKTASPPHGSDVSPGSTITYTLTLSNVGNAMATGVRITDVIPSGLVNYVSGSASPTPIGTNPPVWTLGSLSPFSAPVAFTFRVTVTTPLTNGTIINNLAQASADNALTASSNVVTHRVASTVALAVAKVANPAHGSNVLTVDTINYTILITASGNGYATNMTVTDTLDPNVGLVGVPSPPQTSGPNPLVWDGSLSLGGGSVLTISFNVTVTQGITQNTIISNTARISARETPLTSTNVVTHLVIPATSVLTVTKSAAPPHGSTVSSGGLIVYTVRVTNTGTYTATGLFLSDDIPANTNYVSGSASGTPGGSWGYDSAPPPTLTYTISSLGPNSFITFTFQVTVSTSFTDGIISNLAQMSSTGTALQNSNTVTHLVRTLAAGDIYLPIILKDYLPLPDLVPISLVVVPSPVGAGVPAAITVTIVNSGSAAAGGFWVDLYINPSSVPVVNQRWNDLNPAEGIAWSVPGLAPGASVTLVSTCSDPAVYPVPPCFGSRYSRWPGYFVSGSPRTLYVQADSWGPPNWWAGVQECLTPGCPEEANNLWGPTVTSLGVEEEEGIAPAGQQQEIAPRPLPWGWEKR